MNQSVARIEIDPSAVVARLTRTMTGACIEDVNHELYGGIYSQMIFGEHFVEAPPEPQKDSCGPVSGMWDAVKKGDARAMFALETKDVLDSPQAQRIVFLSGNGEVGVSNRGLNRWGMSYREGKSYEGVIWAKTDKAAQVWVSLESADGKARYGEKALKLGAGKWQRLAYRVTANEDDGYGRFVVSLREPGDVLLGYASLEPGSWGRFKGLPVRKDVGDALVAQGLTVLRMGGCMVNRDTYLWKNQIGPRDRRKPYKGFWHPNSSNGWGPIEFIAFCKAAGFECIPDLSIDEQPEDVGDLIEYVNGPVTSKWGKLRAEHGHPEPYGLRYIQLGNEEQLNETYWAKFEPMAKAVWARDPKIVVVVGDFAYHDDIVDPWNFTGGAGCGSLAIQKKILDLAKAHKRPVWFDLHVGNDEPRQVMNRGGAYLGLRSYIAAMKKIADGAEFKVVVFEENAGNHTLRRGLGHARMIGRLEQIGDDVPMVCAANCLQPNGQNDNDWDQGLLFLSPTGVWGQSSYYVTQMISKHYLPQCVGAKVSDDGGDLDVTAKKSEDGRILQIQVVNMADRDIVSKVDFGKWKPSKGFCEITYISGAWDDVNTEADPMHIAPRSRLVKVSGEGIKHAFPARSFTILRFE